jgi:hypothetical protein
MYSISVTKRKDSHLFEFNPTKSFFVSHCIANYELDLIYYFFLFYYFVWNKEIITKNICFRSIFTFMRKSKLSRNRLNALDCNVVTLTILFKSFNKMSINYNQRNKKMVWICSRNNLSLHIIKMSSDFIFKIRINIFFYVILPPAPVRFAS